MRWPGAGRQSACSDSVCRGASGTSLPAYGPASKRARRDAAFSRRSADAPSACVSSSSTPSRRVGSKLTLAPGPNGPTAFGSKPISSVSALR